MRLSLVYLRNVVLTSVAFVAGTAAHARAQAWVGERGELGLGLDYNFSTASKVVTDTTMEFLDAGTTGHQLTISADYIPVSKLAVSVALPVVALKYTGDQTTFVHPGGGSYDDGSYHSTLTDLRAGVRYQVLADPVAIAPHLAVSIPLADYETVGNTVAGRHLKMLHLGVSVGYLIGVAAYLHATYEFTIAEKYDRTPDTAKYGQSRSDATLSVGYLLLGDRLDVHLGANLRRTHGGIDFSEFDTGALSNDALLYHDAILKENVFLAGAGAGYSLSNTLSATLDVRFFVNALSENTLNASIVALGFAWRPLLR